MRSSKKPGKPDGVGSQRATAEPASNSKGDRIRQFIDEAAQEADINISNPPFAL
jgi:hypothetical protein